LKTRHVKRLAAGGVLWKEMETTREDGSEKGERNRQKRKRKDYNRLHSKSREEMVLKDQGGVGTLIQ